MHRFRNMSSGEHSISVICWMRRRVMKKVTRNTGSILTSKTVENVVARKLGKDREKGFRFILYWKKQDTYLKTSTRRLLNTTDTTLLCGKLRRLSHVMGTGYCKCLANRRIFTQGICIASGTCHQANMAYLLSAG